MTRSDALRKLVEHARRCGRLAESEANLHRNEPKGVEQLKRAKAWEEAAQWIERNAAEDS